VIPTLFGIYFLYVFEIVHASLDADAGVSLLSRDAANFCNLAGFQAQTKAQIFVVHELLYADDAALCASSPEQLQSFFKSFSDVCNCFELTTSLKKTVTLSQSLWTHTFTINQNQLEDVDKFTYLGSTFTKNATVD